MKPAAGKVRCAIYTRKSSDEGLEQSFNSLDAQRAACAAYVASQTSEGWHELPTLYDDGGLSGGTLERPALQRLLADIAAGLVDIVVVYKVDRLSRSLLDFAKLVEAFDKASVSFVSITQSFNTTTSMGRLTLNMLLSFAQFEREVTAERIRDKIAASKARGMWMGGTAPLGYRPDGRSLAIVEDHAALVRHIFDRYLVLGNVRLLADELRREGITVPQRVTASGRPLGGGWFSRGLLHVMLRRVTYDGQIAHCDKVYGGNHPAIIDHDVFVRVQAMLAGHIQGKRDTPRATRPSVLAGRIFDEAGEPLTPTHAKKGAKRYRYYVSRALHYKASENGMRIPALEIETLVTREVRQLFADPLQLASRLGVQVQTHQLQALSERCATISNQLGSPASPLLHTILERVVIDTASVAISCNRAAIANAADIHLPDDGVSLMEVRSDAQFKRSGHVLRLIQGDGSGAAAIVDSALIKLIVKSRSWWAIMQRDQIGVSELARREGVARSYVCRIIRLAFLSPAVIEAILAGRQRAEVMVATFSDGTAVTPCWKAQAKLLLPD